jgi:REP element-mobilizing transposase RayT
MNTHIENEYKSVLSIDASTPNDYNWQNNINHQYYSKNSPSILTHQNTPHLHQDTTTCFVTFRLKDSIPEENSLAIFELLKSGIIKNKQLILGCITNNCHDLNQLKEKFLDIGHGKCILKNPKIKEIVEGSLLHLNGIKYDLHSFVVMPNHVHILFAPKEGFLIQNIVKDWKSFTAHKINKLLKTQGPVWDMKFWDRLIRDPNHYVNVLKYIYKNNPFDVWINPEIKKRYLSEFFNNKENNSNNDLEQGEDDLLPS